MDETQLVHAAQKGDLDAFNQLVLAYQEVAFNVAYRILSDDDASEDATQNAFLSAYRKISSYRGGSFRAWLLRIVTNACYDEMRRRKRHPTTALEPHDNDNDEEIESPSWLADDGPGPEDIYERAELEKAVQNCLEGLPVDFRAVVVMVDVQGFNYEEVAQVIGKPLGTVKSRLARARLKVKNCLQGIWELLPVDFRLGTEET
ncbi:MAG TPA: sigma-70 family RNA polymerase sigma factor [Levilinea sp.]|nr:sigma-70 family RNA polymerase sigma factor [Levilinea sp.]